MESKLRRITLSLYKKLKGQLFCPFFVTFGFSASINSSAREGFFGVSRGGNSSLVCGSTGPGSVFFLDIFVNVVLNPASTGAGNRVKNLFKNGENPGACFGTAFDTVL